MPMIENTKLFWGLQSRNLHKRATLCYTTKPQLSLETRKRKAATSTLLRASDHHTEGGGGADDGYSLVAKTWQLCLLPEVFEIRFLQ